VKEKTNLLRLHNLADAYGFRPSALFTLETDLADWQLDEACLIVGRRVENNLNAGKDMWAGFENESGLLASMKRGYASAKQFVKKKMKIPESGVW
jgi:hypothetical protein